MKKVGLCVLAILVVLAVICGAGYYLSRPATVSVGPETVPLNASNGYVLYKNMVGALSGYGRCDITNLSYYWVEINGLYYSDGGGVLISDYAAQGLKKLIEKGEGDLAYKIAQESFDRVQKKYDWGTEYKLIYPLKFDY